MRRLKLLSPLAARARSASSSSGSSSTSSASKSDKSQPLFTVPKLSAWSSDMESSDWSYYGLTYAKIFAAFTTIGLAASWYIGPSPEAPERRKNTRPMRIIDVREGWKGIR